MKYRKERPSTNSWAALMVPRPIKLSKSAEAKKQMPKLENKGLIKMVVAVSSSTVISTQTIQSRPRSQARIKLSIKREVGETLVCRHIMMRNLRQKTQLAALIAKTIKIKSSSSCCKHSILEECFRMFRKIWLAALR